MQYISIRAVICAEDCSRSKIQEIHRPFVARFQPAVIYPYLWHPLHDNVNTSLIDDIGRTQPGKSVKFQAALNVGELELDVLYRPFSLQIIPKPKMTGIQ